MFVQRIQPATGPPDHTPAFHALVDYAEASRVETFDFFGHATSAS